MAQKIKAEQKKADPLSYLHIDYFLCVQNYSKPAIQECQRNTIGNAHIYQTKVDKWYENANVFCFQVINCFFQVINHL